MLNKTIKFHINDDLLVKNEILANEYLDSEVKKNLASYQKKILLKRILSIFMLAFAGGGGILTIGIFYKGLSSNLMLIALFAFIVGVIYGIFDMINSYRKLKKIKSKIMLSPEESAKNFYEHLFHPKPSIGAVGDFVEPYMLLAPATKNSIPKSTFDEKLDSIKNELKQIVATKDHVICSRCNNEKTGVWLKDPFPGWDYHWRSYCKKCNNCGAVFCQDCYKKIRWLQCPNCGNSFGGSIPSGTFCIEPKLSANIIIKAIDISNEFNEIVEINVDLTCEVSVLEKYTSGEYKRVQVDGGIISLKSFNKAKRINNNWYILGGVPELVD